MKRPDFNLNSHDVLLSLATDEGQRRGGWKAAIKAKDEDPEHKGSTSKALPGAGVLVISRDSQSYAIPYHLPEASDQIVAAVGNAIEGAGRYARMLKAG